jgi:probable addiction module antidote protein
MNQKIKISKFPLFEVADYLKTDLDMEQYLVAAIGDGDSTLLAAAIEDIAKAKGCYQDPI